MSNVASRVFRYAPAFMKKWGGQIDAQEQAWSAPREQPVKHGARSGAVYGPSYGALHKPRYEMGTPLGRYGRRAHGARMAPSWPQKKHAPARRRWGLLPRGSAARPTARLRARERALAKRTRSGIGVCKQDLRRALAKALLVMAAVFRATSRVGRWAHVAHLLHLAHLSKQEPPHTPLGRRGRQTSLRVEPTATGAQLTFTWAEGEPHAVKAPAPIVHELEVDSGVTAYKRGYMSPDAQLAAHELHFDQSNARAIHGAISSASRHAQGKRDHRGA